MPKSKDDKKNLFESYKKMVQDAETIFFVEPNGLLVNEIISFRKKLKELNAEFHFIKNTVFKKALEGEKEILEVEDGKNAAVFVNANSIEVAKLLKEFEKEAKDRVSIKMGIFNNEKIDKAQVLQLASLPSREELLTKFVIVLNGPASGLVNVLTGNTRNLLNVLKAISEKQ